ncbi:hypothetical protein LEAN103870_03150 [Legionella anisa]|uniref:Coiled-coil protein n=1 Tax=Legionella anisa TaxID=28082 RepID=A0AAX0WY98_9GAMM|nr:hypothetical protein [Legionella anisa]AWN72748.1 hypothetical protein DLD14_02205 [Legionella anisa]KTC72999.1 coiled-coil protein [Legionella anisa]MBN5935854.1 hypothetical protein [Legionella anisa]MCW8423539.1 hypothetical protein [Legionella anisa]MCW8447059.1 hypothetical protein [Legionella anisa]
MSSIFVRTTKALTDRVLNKSIEDSIKDDTGMFYGYFRDTKHSEQQRSLTRTLQKCISDFSKEDTDKNNLATIKEQISTIDTAVEVLRKKKSWNRGDLNETLSKLNSSLDRFYRALVEIPALAEKTFLLEKASLGEKKTFLGDKPFSLIDVADDDDPFNLLCAHAAYYLGEHIICPPEEGMLAKIYETVSNTISHSTAIEIRAKKEDCLMKHILRCKEKLDGLDKEKSNYKELRKTFVLEAIDAIQRENAGICEESKPIDSIPVQVTLIAVARVKAPTIKPSRGRLKVAMDNALEEIKERCPSVSEEAKSSLTV